MADFWDPEIANLDLSDEEKNGLQVFKNYQRAFEDHEIQDFIAKSNTIKYDTSRLKEILNLYTLEDVRFLSVISCSFFDELLVEMFKREIPKSIPGGQTSVFKGFGSLSTFSQRIQMAYAFGWMNKDILEELNKLRKIRNDISHSWDINNIRSKLSTHIDLRMFKIEEMLKDQKKLPEKFWKNITSDSKYRIRLIWMTGRCFYESLLFPSAVKQRLNPNLVLYGKTKSNLLLKIATESIYATSRVPH